MLTENKDCAAKDLGGGVTRKVLSYDETMMVCELTFKKGSVGNLHHHPHHQIGYVLSGSFEVTCAGEEGRQLFDQTRRDSRRSRAGRLQTA